MKRTVIISILAVAAVLLLTSGFKSGTAPTPVRAKVTISGTVSDFEGNTVDGSVVRLLDRSFKPVYETYTDKNGRYSLEVESGKYMAMYAMRPEEYPRANAVPEEDMRLEFWAWNIVADRDTEINPRYEKLELYGTTVFGVFGGYPGFFVYFRPMSLTKMISYEKEIYLDKAGAEKTADISVKPEHLKVKVFADGEPLKINSVQPVQEFIGGGPAMIGYIVQVDTPRTASGKPYIMFRIEAENTEEGEKGENIYFYEKPSFISAQSAEEDK